MKDYNNKRCSKFFIFEFLILLICPIPFFESYVKIDYFVVHRENGIDIGKKVTTYQFMSDYILVIMFLRLFFLFRCIFNYSIYTDAFSKRLCRQYGFYPGFRFIFKCLFVIVPSRTVITMFTCTIFFFAYIIRVFEVHYALQDDTMTHAKSEGLYFNSVYLIIVTLTTVGFGDFSPKTYPGKIIIMMTSIWGAVMISLVVLVVSNVFDLTK